MLTARNNLIYFNKMIEKLTLEYCNILTFPLKINDKVFVNFPSKKIKEKAIVTKILISIQSNITVVHAVEIEISDTKQFVNHSVLEKI